MVQEILKAEVVGKHLVRNLDISKEFPLADPTVISYLNKNFRLSNILPTVGLGRILPIVGIYEHPFDKKSVTLTRLLEEEGIGSISRNFIIVTELNQNGDEATIGNVYFRVLVNQILADGFFIGEGFSTHISEEDAEKYRGRGLGSLVLKTAEGLFKNRYKKDLVQFEGEIGLVDNEEYKGRENFFVKNGYLLVGGENIRAAGRFEKIL